MSIARDLSLKGSDPQAGTIINKIHGLDLKIAYIQQIYLI